MNVLAREWAAARTEAERVLASLKEYDESKHPRGEGGRWTDGGGGDIDDDVADSKLREAEDVSQFAAPAQGPNGHGDIRPGVNGYSGVGESFQINRILRAAGFGLPPDIEEVVTNLDAEIWHSKATADRLVSRGVEAGPFADALVPGATVRDKGFMSASRDRDWAERMFAMGGGAVIDIKVPKGRKMLTVARSGEEEVILPRGTALKINSRVKSGKIWRIGAEVVGQ